jgi:hypothetical protein
LLDENVTERLIMLLIMLGHDATSVGRIGSKGWDAAAQLLHATSLGRVVITYDIEDYEFLHRVETMVGGLGRQPRAVSRWYP